MNNLLRIRPPPWRPPAPRTLLEARNVHLPPPVPPSLPPFSSSRRAPDEKKGADPTARERESGLCAMDVASESDPDVFRQMQEKGGFEAPPAPEVPPKVTRVESTSLQVRLVPPCFYVFTEGSDCLWVLFCSFKRSAAAGR